MPTAAQPRKLRYLWLLVPLAGVTEPLLAAYQARRPPSTQDWLALKPHVAAIKGPHDLVLIAPEWAEPLARFAFGDELMPIASTARADEAPFERAVEVDALSASAPLASSWPIVSEERVGKFRLRVRKNPTYRALSFNALEHVFPEDLSVFETYRGQRHDCDYRTNASPSAGGLHGHPAFPRERFTCGRQEANFVGITIIDDQHYAPRRCIWANPTLGHSLTLVFSNVHLGSVIHGYAGLPYFLFRDPGWLPIGLRVTVNNVELGTYQHDPATGWHAFEFGTQQFAGQVGTVEFTVEAADDPREQAFCFYADTR